MRVAAEITSQSDQNSRAEKSSSRPPCPTDDCALDDAASPLRQHLALAAQATNDALRDWDVSTGELSWPQGLESLLGYESKSVPREIDFWYKGTHPQDRARVVLGLREALASSAEHWSGEYRFRHADGHYLHLLERAVIVRNAKGAAIRLVGSLMDISARQALQDQMVRSQKMEAFGQLAGGVAHDFNNFLTTILGYSDLLLEQSTVKGHIAEQITEIRNAAKRASGLTSQLLAFSRRQPLESRVMDLNKFITQTERSLLRLVGENISVECHFQQTGELPHIKVDPNQLTQIMVNLAVNARDAMPKGGRLTIDTATLRIDEGTQTSCHTEKLAPGEYVLINVTDTGAGMSDEVKAHVFEPFFTTKDDGHSSGLGLATTYGIVRQSGGYIRVDSRVGKGTMVTIYFPRVPAPPPPSYKRPGKKSPTGTETILVLEDDVSVRHLSIRVLRALGYEVLEAANGEDAQRLIGYDQEKKIHLLLTDMVMPKMSGKDFADWLGEASPHTKVVFISGYLEELGLLSNSRGQKMFFLPKPFEPEQLAQKIREALDS